MGRGFPVGRAKGKDGEPKPDLQKLGMKFGGQISITSTGNQAKKSDRGNDGQVGGLFDPSYLDARCQMCIYDQISNILDLRS